MANKEQFVGLMSEFRGRLEQLDNDLVQFAGTRHVDAARLHLKQSNDWIENVIVVGVPGHASFVAEPSAINGVTYAVNRLGKTDFGNPAGIIETCRVIDQAMAHTYDVCMQNGLGPIKIEPPSTYEKTFSVLPGEPAFPTDPPKEESHRPPGGSSRRTIGIPDDKDAASILPGDPEFPTDPDPVPKSRSDDFLP
jgi:hypothetical protein